MKIIPNPYIIFKTKIKCKIILTCILAIITGFTSILPAQELALSIEDAIKLTLEKNPNVESANWDWLSATSHAKAASWKMFPSLSVSASYERLSELPPSLVNVYKLSANLQYPIFAGFRMREAAAIAKLQTENKSLAVEMLKRSLIFEVQRAYGEALRAEQSVLILQKNLELAKFNYKLVSDRADMGTATRADLLAADTQNKQAEIDLNDAISMQKHAYLVLASLVGKNSQDIILSTDMSNTSLPFSLSTEPQDIVRRDIETPDDKKLIQLAISRRPETRISTGSIQMAEHNVKLAKAGLYPTLSLIGNYTYADPNPRVPMQTDPYKFTDTWSIGLQITYNFGEIPTNLEEKTAQSHAVRKSMSDAREQQNKVILDVQTCILNLERTRRDFDLVKGIVDQAKENLRVIQQKFDTGTANKTDVLGAELSLLQANFSVINKEIDVQIATADLTRAAAMEDIK